MVPIVAELIANGIGILGNAILGKGKSVVEEKLGVKIPDTSIPPEQLVELKKLEFQHEEWLLGQGLEQMKLEFEFQKVQESAVTDRWKSDMASDSWLSKNVRPSVLLYILSAYTVLSLMSAFGLDVNEAYVSLLGQWGMLVMTAYFGGRSLEKIIIHKNERKGAGDGTGN